VRTLRRAEPETRRSQDAETYSNDNGIFFMETSAKTATNVNELFVAIGAPPRAARHAHHACPATRPATHHTDLLLKGALLLRVRAARKLPKNTPQQRPGQPGGIVLAQNDAASPKKGGCC
jgi:hypothetical protein